MKNYFLSFFLFFITSCSVNQIDEISGNESACLDDYRLTSFGNSHNQKYLERVMEHYQYCEPDVNKLIYFSELAVDSGSVHALYVLSSIYMDGASGYEVTSVSCHKGLEYLKAIGEDNLDEALANCMRRIK